VCSALHLWGKLANRVERWIGVAPHVDARRPGVDMQGMKLRVAFDGHWPSGSVERLDQVIAQPRGQDGPTVVAAGQAKGRGGIAKGAPGRRHPGQLRTVRPARDAALAADPGPGQDHPVPGGPARGGGEVLPAHRPAADPPAQHRPDHRALGRPAPVGRVPEIRPRHRIPAGRQALGIGPAERAGRRAQGVRRAAPHRLRRPLPRRPGLPAQNLPAAQQGRVAARTASRSALRPRGHDPGPAPGDPDRTGVVPDPGHQRRHRLLSGVSGRPSVT